MPDLKLVTIQAAGTLSVNITVRYRQLKIDGIELQYLTRVELH
jgi:hypothetical protein